MRNETVKVMTVKAMTTKNQATPDHVTSDVRCMGDVPCMGDVRCTGHEATALMSRRRFLNRFGMGLGGIAHVEGIASGGDVVQEDIAGDAVVMALQIAQRPPEQKLLPKRVKQGAIDPSPGALVPAGPEQTKLHS